MSPGPITVAGAMAENHIAFCEQVVREPTAMIGYSAGAAVTLTAAATRPDLVTSLVLISGFHDPGQLMIKPKSGQPQRIRRYLLKTLSCPAPQNETQDCAADLPYTRYADAIGPLERAADAQTPTATTTAEVSRRHGVWVCPCHCQEHRRDDTQASAS